MGQHLKGRVAIVTGAGSGIGRATALALASAGALVAAADLSVAAAQASVEQIRQSGGQAVAVEVDVAGPESVRNMMDRTHSALGPVSILVNCAGICPTTPLLEVTLDEWNRVLAVNLTGAFLCAQAVLPDMMANQWGRIVNISSLAGQVGGIIVGPHYAASKGGLLALTKSLALVGAGYGITANAIAPGTVDTPMRDNFACRPGAAARELPWCGALHGRTRLPPGCSTWCPKRRPTSRATRWQSTVALTWCRSCRVDQTNLATPAQDTQRERTGDYDNVLRTHRQDPPRRPDPRHVLRAADRRRPLPPLPRRQGAGRLSPAAEIPPGVDPLGPDNVLVLANGLLTGAPISTATRFTAAARSPLTGGVRRIGGGRLLGAGAEVGRLRGHHHHGPRRHPVYLGITDDTCETPRCRGICGAATRSRSRRPARGDGGPARARAADRPGRREPGALRRADQRSAPLQRPHRHGRGDGLEEPQGDRGARAWPLRSTMATTRRRWVRDRPATGEEGQGASAKLGPAAEGHAGPGGRSERRRHPAHPQLPARARSRGWTTSSGRPTRRSC